MCQGVWPCAVWLAIFFFAAVVQLRCTWAVLLYVNVLVCCAVLLCHARCSRQTFSG